MHSSSYPNSSTRAPARGQAPHSSTSSSGPGEVNTVDDQRPSGYEFQVRAYPGAQCASVIYSLRTQPGGAQHQFSQQVPQYQSPSSSQALPSHASIWLGHLLRSQSVILIAKKKFPQSTVQHPLAMPSLPGNFTQVHGGIPPRQNIPNNAAGTPNSWGGGGQPHIHTPYDQPTQVLEVLFSPMDGLPHHSSPLYRRLHTTGRPERRAPTLQEIHRM